MLGEQWKKLHSRICLYCEKEFRTLIFSQKYCSETCRKSAAAMERKIKQLNIITRKCKHCGKKFDTGINKKIYCSTICQQENMKSKSSKSYLIWQVLNRDNFQCQYCGKNPTQDRIRLDVDHIKPKVDGGKNDLDNLVTACKQCNSLKSGQPLRYEAEFKERLRRNKKYATPQIALPFYCEGVKWRKRC